MELIPILNFNNDQKIQDLQNKLKVLIVDPDKLRLIPKFRKEMAEKAEEILNSL